MCHKYCYIFIHESLKEFDDETYSNLTQTNLRKVRQIECLKTCFFTSKNVPGGAHQFEGLASRIFIHPAEERFVRKGSALMTVSWITPQVIWLESFTQMISIVRLVLRHYSSSACRWITEEEHTPREHKIAGSSPGAWLFFISPTFLKRWSVPIMPR